MTQHSHRRFRRLGSLVAVSALSALTLAACGGGGDDDSGSDGGGSTEAADSFTFAFGNASGSAESPWIVMAEKYTEETGVEVELAGLPPDSYGLSLRTQLQGGNAPDVMVVSPGAGQDNAVLPLAEAGYLEPLGDASTDLDPRGQRGAVPDRRRDLRPADRPHPRGHALERRRGRRTPVSRSPRRPTT